MECLWKSLVVRPFQVTLLVALAFVGAHLQAAEKVAVISLKPADQLFTDVDYLLNAAGMQGLGQFFLPQIKAYFKDVNTKQPLGVVVMVEEMEFTPIGFLPVRNLPGFLEMIQEQVGAPIDAGDGVLELQGPQPLFVKEQSGWAFFGQTKTSLSELPADPAKLLEGLDQQYALGIRAFVRNVPEAYKQMAASQIREGLQRGMAEADDPNARKMAEAQVAQLTQLIQETESLTFGWQIDPGQRRTYFDVALQPISGSKIDTQIAANREAKTGYGGFLAQDAAIHANMFSILTPDQIEESLLSIATFEKSTLAQIENDGDIDNRTRAAAKQLVQTFFKIAGSTVKTGKFDTCTSVILKPKALTLISGGHVASGSEVETAIKQLVAMAQNESEFSFSSVKLNADEHAGVRFHTLDLPIPEEEYVRKVLGENLNIVVGVADQSAYIALGTEGLDYLKQSIDASNGGQQTVEPFNLEISLLPILEFAQSVEDNPMVQAVTQIVASAQGKDHIRVRTTVDGTQLMYRLELEEGILKILGQAGQMVSMGGGF